MKPKVMGSSMLKVMGSSMLKVMGSSMLKVMGIIVSAFERNYSSKQTYSSTCINFLLLFAGTCL